MESNQELLFQPSLEVLDDEWVVYLQVNCFGRLQMWQMVKMRRILGQHSY
jgi:hypothetical protein